MLKIYKGSDDMFKKLCKCGLVIPISEGACSRCQEDKEQHKADRYRSYDKTRPDYHKVYKTKRWRIARTDIINRDNYLCMSCKDMKSIDGGNIVHHIVPLEDNIDLACRYSNLITLCDSCHRQTHIKYDASSREKKEEQIRLQQIVDNL